MKKLLLALPLVAGASWAGTTYYSGAQTEAAYTRLLEQMNANKVFVLKSTQYEAGIMESTAITEVRSAEGSSKDVLFFLKHKINHSLVSVAPENPRFGAASIITTLMVDENYSDEAKEFLKSFETGEAFVATTEVAVDGATKSEIKINALDHKDGDVTVVSSGSLINIKTTASGNVSGDGLTKDFVFNEGPDKTAEMSNLSMNFDMSRLASDDKVSPFFYDVNFEMELDESRVVDSGAPVALIKGVRYIVKQNLSSDEPSANLTMNVDSIEVDELPLKSFDIEADLTGFSVTELMANEAFFQQMKEATNPEEIMFGPKGLELLRATIKPNTKMAITANAVSDDGNADAFIDLTFAGNGSDDGYTDMLTAGDLAKSITGKAIIDVDKTAIMNTPLGAMLDNPMAQAYLTITEDRVSLNANLEKLVLKVNEQMIPLEMMAGEMLDMPLEALLQM